ncbi:hypothetical protein EON63_23950 [archaeon]|nr:MAG: hypothetical protein EON63_23950 [archaeon]
MSEWLYVYILSVFMLSSSPYTIHYTSCTHLYSSISISIFISISISIPIHNFYQDHTSAYTLD